MKRSKIFLGVTTTLLAIVGIAAANQQKHVTTLLYTTAGDCAVLNQCPKVSPQTLYSAVGNSSTRLSTVINGSRFALCYTDGNATCIPAFKGQ